MSDPDVPDRPPFPATPGDFGRHDAPGALPDEYASALPQVFGGLPATIWMTDRDLVLRFIEGQLLRRLQILPERVIGRTLHDLLLDGREDHPLIHGHLAALAGHETNVRIEWGGDIYSARVAPCRDRHGAIVGVVGVHQQIGWMPDDDSTLRETDVRLRRAVDANPVGIAFGNEDGRITDANDAFFDLSGYTREDLTADGMSWVSMVPVDCHQRHLEAIDEVKRAGRCNPFDSELIRRDGRRIEVLVGGARLSVRRREGVMFVMDVTAARRASRLQAAELACADALLTEADPRTALSRVLAALCVRGLWTAAALWRRDKDVNGLIVAWEGATDISQTEWRTLADRAHARGDVAWSETAHTLAIPVIRTETQSEVLLLVTAPHDTPHADLITASRAIAERLQRHRVSVLRNS